MVSHPLILSPHHNCPSLSIPSPNVTSCAAILVERMASRLLLPSCSPRGPCYLPAPYYRTEFLSKFVPIPSPNVPSCAAALVERMASRLLLFFARHASLVRPLGAKGKLQLAKDLAELQLGVGQVLWPLEQLPLPHRVLKAFRALLFQVRAGGGDGGGRGDGVVGKCSRLSVHLWFR